MRWDPQEKGTGIRRESSSCSSSSSSRGKQRGKGVWFFFFPSSPMIQGNSIDGTPLNCSLLLSLPRKRHQEQERFPPANEHGIEGQRRTDGQDRVRRKDEHDERVRETSPSTLFSIFLWKDACRHPFFHFPSTSKFESLNEKNTYLSSTPPDERNPPPLLNWELARACSLCLL